MGWDRNISLIHLYSMEEIQKTADIPMKKTRYWLWFGFAFTLVMLLSLFGEPMYLEESSAGLRIFYDLLWAISHILYISDWLDNSNGWFTLMGYFLVLASEQIPFIFWLYPISLLWIYFIIGALIGKIYGKVKSNSTTFVIFLLLIVSFVTYRLYIYKLEYYPNQTKDCLIYSDEFEQWECISDLARNKKDVTMCQEVPVGSNYERDCYEMVAFEVREYWVCDHMKFGKQFSYPHKTACRDDIATFRSECDKVSTTEGQDRCYANTWLKIQIYAKQNACNRLKEVLGLKHLIMTCEDFRLWKITVKDLCAKIFNEKNKTACLLDSPEFYVTHLGPERPEAVEWLYWPGKPETEEEIRNRLNTQNISE